MDLVGVRVSMGSTDTVTEFSASTLESCWAKRNFPGSEEDAARGGRLCGCASQIGRVARLD
jgi:hypothetical protein